MKTILVLLAFAASTVSALDIVAGKKVYLNCTELRASGETLRFTHSEGTASLRHDDLPAAIQTKYFNAEELNAARQQRIAAEQAQKAAAEAAELAAKKAYENRNAALDRKAAEVAATEAARQARLAEEREAKDKDARARAERDRNCTAGKWQRFVAVMVGPTRDGQIMRKPDGMTIHVVSDLGKAQGEKVWGYFERDGNYDYTASGGGASRVQNYQLRASAMKDMTDDMLRCGDLYLQYLKGKANRVPAGKKITDELIRLHVKLESEGAPVSKLEF